MKQHIKIRDHNKDDHSFFLATYLRNNWYSKENSTTLKKATWMSLQHKRLGNVLETQKIKVACDASDSDSIFGYAFHDGEKPFVYIKLAFRDPKWKIKEMLLESLSKEKEQ